MPQKFYLAHRQWGGVRRAWEQGAGKETDSMGSATSLMLGDQEVGVGDLQVASVMAHSGEFPLCIPPKSELHYTSFEEVMVRELRNGRDEGGLYPFMRIANIINTEKGQQEF